MKSLTFFLLLFTPFTYCVAKPTTIDISKEQAILAQKAPTINKKALNSALKAYQCASLRGQVRKPILTVIDYSKPSSKPRLWTFNLKNHHLLFHSLVAHGKNTGELYAKNFSDRFNSKQSSLGVFLTGQKYMGSHGDSLYINGMEQGVNQHAKARTIVMHGAHYVSNAFVKAHGRLGRSWGCPAVAQNLAKPIVNTIKGGSLLFSYYPDSHYLNTSKYLHC